MILVELDTGCIYDLKEKDLDIALQEIDQYPFVEGVNGDYLNTKKIIAVKEED